MMEDLPTATTASRPHLSEKSNNASISFDLTIEMTASGDESSAKVDSSSSSRKQIALRPRPNKVSTHNNNNNQNNSTTTGKQQHKIVLPILVSPDDGSLSMAWDEASNSSLASKSVTTTASTTANRVVRFQGITTSTTTTGAGGMTAAVKEGGHGGEDQGTIRTTVDKLHADISRQRLLRKRKEKALIKLAKELSKRTLEVTEKDKTIANQVDRIHHLEQKLLLLAQRTNTTTHHDQTSNDMIVASSVDETTAHLRKELLRLQLSNDRLLQAQWNNNNNNISKCWPSALTMVLVMMVGCLMHMFRIMTQTG